MSLPCYSGTCLRWRAEDDAGDDAQIMLKRLLRYNSFLRTDVINLQKIKYILNFKNSSVFRQLNTIPLSSNKEMPCEIAQKLYEL